MASRGGLSVVERRGRRPGGEDAESEGPQRESVACHDEDGGLAGMEWDEPLRRSEVAGKEEVQAEKGATGEWEVVTTGALGSSGIT